MQQLKTTVLLLAIGGLMAACQKKGVSENVESPQTSAGNPDLAQLHVCTELTPDGTTPRGATLKVYQWPNGRTLKVSLNGSTSFVRSKVIAFARQWEQYANIKFQFVTGDPSAAIRVTFTPGGSWSYIGTAANYISSSQPTMNFGWFTNSTTDTEFSRTTIHEFGHALGMIHEHQHPLANIPWDKPKVYDYYKRTQGWGSGQVDNNIFMKYATKQTNFSAYDKTSIMHYAVPEELTIGTFSVGWNTVLSALDKSFIAGVYPK